MPRRSVESGFGPTTYSTVPLPCPVRGDAIEIQDASVDTDQVHSRSAETLRLPVPPFGPTEATDWLTEIGHRDGEGPMTVVDEDLHAAVKSTQAATRPEYKTLNEGCVFTM
jgi:hypothetical protein